MFDLFGTIYSETIGRRRDRRDASRAIEQGHQADVRYSLEKEKSLFDRAMERGMTPTEYYGSSAPGAPGVSGGAQVLGNSANKRNIQGMQLMSEAVQKAADRKTIERGQDKQLEAAKVSAGATKYSADTSFKAVMQKLDFDKQQFQQVTLPQAARIAKKTDQEIEYLINQVATSEPKFIRMLKIMTMGTDNTLGLAIQNTLGIDVSDLEQMQNLTAEQRQALIQGMMAAGSVAAKEIAGAQMTVNQYLDTFAKALEKAASGLGEITNPGIQPMTPQLGRNRKRGHGAKQ